MSEAKVARLIKDAGLLSLSKHFGKPACDILFTWFCRRWLGDDGKGGGKGGGGGGGGGGVRKRLSFDDFCLLLPYVAARALLPYDTSGAGVHSNTGIAPPLPTKAVSPQSVMAACAEAVGTSFSAFLNSLCLP